MLLLMLVLGWAYPTSFCCAYLLKNRNKASLRHYDPRLQAVQTLCGWAALLGTYRLEGFAADEWSMHCLGWNVWLAVGAGKLGWLSLQLLIMVDHVQQDHHRKLRWWFTFFVTQGPLFVFYVAVVADDSSDNHAKDAPLCAFRFAYQLTAAALVATYALLCVVTACLVRMEAGAQYPDLRSRRFLVCVSLLSLLFVVGTLHDSGARRHRAWRVVVVLLNMVPLVVSHSRCTWMPAYLFAKRNAKFVLQDELADEPADELEALAAVEALSETENDAEQQPPPIDDEDDDNDSVVLLSEKQKKKLGKKDKVS